MQDAGTPCLYCWAVQMLLGFPLSDLRPHLLDQHGQLFLTFPFCFGIHISGYAPAVDNGGVAAFPQVVVDLADAAGARFAALSFAGLKGAGGWLVWYEIMHR